MDLVTLKMAHCMRGLVFAVQCGSRGLKVYPDALFHSNGNGFGLPGMGGTIFRAAVSPSPTAYEVVLDQSLRIAVAITPARRKPREVSMRPKPMPWVCAMCPTRKGAEALTIRPKL